ncbi:fibronectin type III domain-containing protein [Halobacillus kuroshimensis]|uniref:Fibronectin type III domain-containing protein n=3 Tax=Bacillaceae TaxID=186817 RepID=A0A845E7V7_9BACI|nr:MULTISPECIES: fibronectin type III domain-containing protein [Halobacillus]MBN8236837.1 fibronectin type III domain-containing protein [Halobacillus kuroshimensis]MYL50259.1 fibronectin type III domain-containing protein [Halobacillus litoralis]
MTSLILGQKLPNAPANLTASNVTDTTADITWDAVDYEAGIEQYEIYRDGTMVDTRVGTSFADSGLTADTTYVYQVIAVGSNGLKSELSEELTVTTVPAV